MHLCLRVSATVTAFPRNFPLPVWLQRIVTSSFGLAHIKNKGSRWNRFAVCSIKWNIRISDFQATVLQFPLPVWSHSYAGSWKHRHSLYAYLALLSRVQAEKSSTWISHFLFLLIWLYIVATSLIGMMDLATGIWNRVAILCADWEMIYLSLEATVLDYILPVYSFLVGHRCTSLLLVSWRSWVFSTSGFYQFAS